MRARRGKPEALAEIYGAGLMRSWADAEDIVQEVLVGLPEALRRYRRASTEGLAEGRPDEKPWPG